MTPVLNRIQTRLHPSHHRRTWSSGVWRLLRRALAVLVALRLVGGGVDAAHIDDLSREPGHNALGDRPGTLWVEASVEFQGQILSYHFTAFPIGKQVDIDGNTIKTFLYVPAHGYAASAQPSTNDVSFIVGDGNNYFTNRGRIFEHLHEEYRAPNFNPSNPRANAGDVGIWSTTTAVPDTWIPQLAPLGMVASQFGDTAFVAGFSRLSTPSTGLLQETGDNYGYYGRTLNAVPGDTQPGIYVSLPYYAGDGLVAYNARLNTGGSGSWVFNSQGQLVGAGVAFTGNYTATAASTIFANFTSSEFYNQLAPYLGIQVVPATCAKITGLTPDRTDTLITFRGQGGTNYFIQAASALGATNSFMDVSVPIAAAGGGAITNTFRHVGALTNSPAGFYRIRIQ